MQEYYFNEQFIENLPSSYTNMERAYGMPYIPLPPQFLPPPPMYSTYTPKNPNSTKKPIIPIVGPVAVPRVFNIPNSAPYPFYSTYPYYSNCPYSSYCGSSNPYYPYPAYYPYNYSSFPAPVYPDLLYTQQD